ncbi:MAG: VIT and VWA domain-containing protein, partial [Gammaproteobacteria bacterium]|nr:VIT and VWA domain-containing protein [Gammaproteobacteria bacterium]
EEVITTASKAGDRRPERSRVGAFRGAESMSMAQPGSPRADEPAGTLPYAGDEEIWVIQKPVVAHTTASSDDPGTGSMVSVVDSKEVPLPLRHTDVKAQINGYISTVNVRQEFTNPFDSKIEAVYMFPLPEKAAITEFLMIIGERKIRGILREKEEAEAIYEAARSQGYRASLMVQHRPNIFEQKVANIEPGKSIDVDIKYFHTLKYNDGWYSFVFPTVIGPRYNPPGHGDPIEALPRQDTTSTGAAVRYLRPDERSAHDISIDVQISAGVEIEELRSTHKIVATQDDEQSASVQLANGATMPNRDFVLDFRVAGETMKSDLLTYVDPETQQGYFTMMLYPPEGTDRLERRNMELVFVLDTSGSMSGVPLTQAKDAVIAALDHLQEGDTFQIIRFSDNSSQFGHTPVPATKDNIKQARRYLANLSGGGGTAMIEGVKAALDFPHDPSRLRFVSFLTDGFIGNEEQILGEVHKRIGSSRVFSFGVGSSVNRFLMERMAKLGKGAVAYLGPQDSGYDVMNGFFNRISHPALTDVRIDWQGMAVSDVYPTVLPDVFVGRPIVVTGKYLGHANDIRILGRQGTRDHSVVIESSDDISSAPYLAKTWARMRIAELADRKTWSHDPYGEIPNEIKATALQHQLMSDYTAFVAVDSSERTEGEYGTTVHQAVPVPDGVRYDTTVNEK